MKKRFYIRENSPIWWIGHILLVILVVSLCLLTVNGLFLAFG